MEKLLGDQQFSTVSFIAEQLDHEIADRFGALAQVAEMLAPLIDHPRLLQKTLEAQHIFEQFFNAGTFITNIDGIAIAASQGSEKAIGVNYTDRDYLAAALHEGEPSIGRAVIGKTQMAPIVAMATPVRNTEGKVIGALVGVINLARPSFFDELTTQGYGESGGYLLISPRHRLIVTATEKARVMETLPAVGINPDVDRILAGYEGTLLMVNSHGLEMMASIKQLPDAGWLLAATLPTAEAFSPIRSMQRHMFLATIFLSLLASLLTWILVRRQLSPMMSAVRTLSCMSSKDQAGLPLPIVANDEIGQLIGAFNRLLEEGQKREAALHESEARYRNLASNSSDWVWAIDLQGRLTYSNEKGLEILGFSTEAFSSLPAQKQIHPDDEAKFRQILEQAIQQRTGWKNELIRFRHQNGSYRSLESSSSPMFDTEGELIGFQGMDRDVTERLAIAAELKAAKCAADKANRAKSHFLAAASHDLRQPLSSLSLYVGVLRKKVEPEHETLMLNIQDCVGTLSTLLTDLLDVSKLEAGVVTPKLSEFAIEELLAPLVSIHTVKAEQKGLTLRWRRSDTRVQTDGQLLHRIIGNLIANAIRYTGEGGVLIACRRQRDKNWLEIWDTGIGIPEDKTELIFEEYRQLGNQEQRGSGLGLAIVAKAARLLNLEIRLRSQEGRGSLFAIELPPPPREPRRTH